MRSLKRFTFPFFVLMLFGSVLSLGQWQTSLSVTKPFLPIAQRMPHLLGFDGKQTYVILFQNNMELRPGGGFIGSYAIVSFDKGHMGPLTIHNVYDADGQLRVHVEPYYIVRRFLQPHLYLRDSNFDVDSVKDAGIIKDMLRKETGKNVDGVVALDTTFFTNILHAVGSLSIAGYNTTITEKNFFMQIEIQSDKNSFPGSMQKQNFLHGLFSSLVEQISQETPLVYIKLTGAFLTSLQERHVAFAFFDPTLQHALTTLRISPSLYDPRVQEKGVINDFLGVNEANIGVNKVNYFLTRSIKQQVSILSSGKITEKLTIVYDNHATQGEWPGGPYSAYVRIAAPEGAVLDGIAFDSVPQKIVAAVTKYQIYERKGFVPPSGLEVDKMLEEGKMLYGFRILVPLHTTKTVTITYHLGRVEDIRVLTKYSLLLLKQPGAMNDPYSFQLVTPKTTVTEKGIEYLWGSWPLPCSSTFLTTLTSDIAIIFPLVSK